MKQFFDDLLLHFFMMMMIPLSYTLVYRRIKELRPRIFFQAILLLTLFLTMYFPVEMVDNLTFDLKFIPIFIAFLYLGSRSGLLTIFAAVLFLSLIEGGKIPILLLNYGIISIPLLYIQKGFYRYSFSRKIIIVSVFYILISFTRLIVLLTRGEAGDSLYLLFFSIVSFSALGTIIYIIEITQLQSYMLQQLQNAEKLNAISQLAASVAHEIRNPMTTIRGFMQLLKTAKNLNDNQHMFVSLSLDELDRTQNIITDFLSLARPSSNEYGIINASSILKEVIDFMGPYSLISNVKIVGEIEENARIVGSSHEFKQLIINLIKNGIEAMPDGGIIKVICFMSKGQVTVDIHDQGIGISKKQLGQLGQPYYSTKTKGTGLGLMISFDIIKRMKGKFKIESNLNSGTCFSIIFQEAADVNV